MTRLAQPLLTPEEQLRAALRDLGRAFANNDMGMPKKIIVGFDDLQKIRAMGRNYATYDVSLSHNKVTGDIEYRLMGIHFDTK